MSVTFVGLPLRETKLIKKKNLIILTIRHFFAILAHFCLGIFNWGLKLVTLVKL